MEKVKYVDRGYLVLMWPFRFTQDLGLATCSHCYEVGIIDGILEIRKH